MVGLGENKEEIIQVMDDLRSAEVDFITIGQYLQPSVKHHPLHRYYHPDEFKELGIIAKTKGFLLVSSSPLLDHHIMQMKTSENYKMQEIKKLNVFCINKKIIPCKRTTY